MANGVEEMKGFLKENKYIKAFQVWWDLYGGNKKSRLADRNAIDIGYKISQGLYKERRYGEALMCCSYVYEERWETLGPSHPDSIDARRSVGHALWKVNRLEEAFDMYCRVEGGFTDQNNMAVDLLEKGRGKEALRFFKLIHRRAAEILGTDHAETLTYKHNVARALHAIGEYREALTILQEVSEIRCRTLGPCHTLTLGTLRAIGMCLFNLDKPLDSVDVFKIAFREAIKALGPDHPDTLLILSDLSHVFTSDEKYAEARQRYQSVSARIKVSIGEGLLKPMISIADMLRKLGMCAEALRIYNEVHSTLRKLRANDCDIFDVWNKMAHVHTDEGRYNEALDMYRDVYQERKRCLGSEHIKTLATRNDIGYMLIRLRNFDEALQVLRYSLKKGGKLSHVGNTEARNTKLLIAEVLAKQGKYLDALRIYIQLYRVQKTLSFSPDRIHVLINIATMFCMLGEYEDSLLAYKEICNLRKKYSISVYRVGKEKNILAALWKDGRDDEILEKYRELLKKSIDVVGVKSIITMDIKTTIAEILANQKKYDEAVKAFKEVYEFQLSMPFEGHNNPAALLLQNTIAKMYFRQSKFEEALQVFNVVRRKLKKTLGADHPDCSDVEVNIIAVKMAKEALEASSECNESSSEDIIKIVSELNDFCIEYESKELGTATEFRVKSAVDSKEAVTEARDKSISEAEEAATDTWMKSMAESEESASEIGAKYIVDSERSVSETSLNSMVRLEETLAESLIKCMPESEKVVSETTEASVKSMIMSKETDSETGIKDRFKFKTEFEGAVAEIATQTEVKSTVMEKALAEARVECISESEGTPTENVKCMAESEETPTKNVKCMAESEETPTKNEAKPVAETEETPTEARNKSIV